MNGRYMQIDIATTGGSDDVNNAGAADVTWQHATSLAARHDVEIGSDRFIEIYHYLEEGYKHCSHHMGYLQYCALSGVRQLLASNNLSLPSNLDEQGARTALIEMAQVLVAWFMWLYVAEDTSWVCNHVWDEKAEYNRSVSFYFENTAGGHDHD